MVTLSRRFAAAFVLLVVIPSIAVSIVLARLYLDALYETATSQAQITAEQVASHIRDDADNDALLAAALIHDEELRALAGALTASESGRPRFEAARNLDAKLAGFFRYTKQVGAILLFLSDRTSYTFSNYPNLRDVGSLERAVYAPAAANPGRVFLLDTLDGVVRNIGARNMITLAVCPSAEYRGPIEAILVTFRVPYLDDLAQRWGADGKSALVLFGRSGKALLSTLPGETNAADLSNALVEASSSGAAMASARAAGRSWLITSHPISSTGWSLLLLADRAELADRVTRHQWHLYAALAVLAGAFLIYAEYFFARVAVPIRRIVQYMGNVGRGDLSVRAEPQRISELVELSQGFNAMVQRVDELGKARERSERERLAAELDALRYQINPHFVSNTLSSIRFMAIASRSDAIADMTRDLMRLLSDSYADGEKLIALARELDNVKAYVGIMKVRFGERFGVEFDCEPGTEQMLTLRLILQPIVENAILHAFPDASMSTAARAGRGTIRISARCELGETAAPVVPEPWARAMAGRILVIEVRDDGAGIDPAKARTLLDGTQRGSGLHRIGLANVQRRIGLNFGPPYGLAIESELGHYTAVRFLLPALERAPLEGGADA